MLNRLFRTIKRKYAIRKGGAKYIQWLRSNGISIGDGCIVTDAKTLDIDLSRPYLITIGNNVRLNNGLTIMTHDFSTMVFKTAYDELLPCSGKVNIGNNVYFGRQCTVLKGVTIGDNCIIGFGSIVMKDIPSGSVAVGRPAKVVCTLEEYYNRRKVKSLEEALELAREIKQTQHRRPIPADFREEFVFFVSGNEVSLYPEIPIEFQLRAWGDCYEKWIQHHRAPYASFDDFLAAAGIE